MRGLYDPSGNKGSPDAAVAALAADEWGVLDLDELRACGLSDTQVRTRTRAGQLHRIHPHVYAVGHDALTLEGWFLAAVKACAPSVLSHFSAAAVWRIVEWDGRQIEATVTGTGGRRTKEIRVHRTLRLDRVDYRRHQGIPVTTPERTLVDLATQLPYLPLRRAVGQALADRLVSVPSLLRAINRLSPRPGLGRLRRVLARGAAPTRSTLEDVFLELIEDSGLERPLVNQALVLDGHRVVPDFLWPKLKLVVEADSTKWHDHEVARAADAERQARLEAHGYQVLRVRWSQLIERRSEVVALLRAAGVPSREG